MRKLITSTAVITAAGALLIGGGAYSTFTDSHSATGSFTTGTVKMAVAKDTSGVDVFALDGKCTQHYSDADHPSDSLNLGTANNLGCTSTFAVHNSGTLPFQLSASSLVDSNSTCFTTTINNDGFGKQNVIPPGTDRHLSVTTVTASDIKSCQTQTDTITASLIATESLPTTVVDVSKDGYFTIGSVLSNFNHPNQPYLYAASGPFSGAPDYVTELDLTMSDGSTAQVTTKDLPITGDGTLTQGWWGTVEGHIGTNTDYFVGSHGASASLQKIRNFFSFPTAGIHGHVVAATLVLHNTVQDPSGEGGGIENFWSVHTPAAVLLADAQNQPNPAIFADLADGLSYAAQAVTTGSGLVSVPLNSNAVSTLNILIGG